MQVDLDDITVTGRSLGEHLETLRLDMVLEIEGDYGIRTNKSKCKRRNGGHVISAHLSFTKKDHELAMPRQHNQTQIRAFLGMVQYYAKFLPRLSRHTF